MRSHHTINALVILAILIAVATSLIAPSIDMPDTVLHENHVASHSVGGHASSNQVHSGLSAPVEARRDECMSRSAKLPRSTRSDSPQSSVVLRC